MAKRLALVALLLCIATLFLPLVNPLPGTDYTRGILVGTEKKIEGLIFIGPTALAAFFGVVIGRNGFGRGLGALHLLLGGANLALLVFLVFGEDRGSELLSGSYAALAASVAATLAGLIGLVKPERRV